MALPFPPWQRSSPPPPPGKKLFVELKSGPEILPPLKAVLAGSALDPSQVMLLSFKKRVIAEARRLIPTVKALWITGYKEENGVVVPAIGEILQALEKTGATGLASQAHPCIDAGFVRALREAGRELHVWTVNDPCEAARLVALGVDSITTDRPGWLRGELRKDHPTLTP